MGCDPRDWWSFVRGYDGESQENCDNEVFFALGGELHEWVLSMGLCAVHQPTESSE